MYICFSLKKVSLLYAQTNKYIYLYPIYMLFMFIFIPFLLRRFTIYEPEIVILLYLRNYIIVLFIYIYVCIYTYICSQITLLSFGSH